MTVISIVNIKGGVGKTQSCINISGALNMLDKKVLLIDNDPQSNLSQILDIKSKYNIYDLYTNPKVNLKDCIVSYNDMIDVVPNSISSAMLEKTLNGKLHGETILKNKLEGYKQEYDYIIIDNSPYLGVLASNSLSASDYYIEVVDNSTSSIEGLSMVNMLAKEVRENAFNRNLKLLGILRNRFEKRTRFTKDFSSVLEDCFSKELFKTIIPDSVKYKEASAEGTTIQEYNKKMSKPYEELVNEIIERIEG